MGKFDDRRAARAAEAAKRREKRERRREYKAQLAHLREEEMPVVCRRDEYEKSTRSVVAGLLCRMAVTAAAVFGSVYFVFDAFLFTASVPWWYILVFSLVFTAENSLILLGPRWYLRTLGALALTGTLTIPFLPAFATNYGSAVVGAFNMAMERMAEAGFTVMRSYEIASPLASAVKTEDQLRLFAVVLAFVLSAAFVLCVMRRIRILPLALLSAAVLVPIFVYNLTNTNLGVALIIASFTALLVLDAFDRIYVKKKGGLDDCFSSPQGGEDETAKSKREIRGGEARRASRKESCKALPEAQRQEQRKERRKARREERREAYAASAAGGIAAAGTFILSLAVIALPALTAKGAFNTVGPLENTLSHYREYVTAWLKGDSPALDYLEYESDPENFAPISTEATAKEYSGLQMFYIESNSKTNVYLKGRTATDYIDGSWKLATRGDGDFETYRSLFGTTSTVTENIRYGFLRFASDGALKDNGGVPSQSVWTAHKYGFDLANVYIKRLNIVSNLIYMPSYHLAHFLPSADFGKFGNLHVMKDWGTESGDGKLTYADYFDGIYTAYKLAEDEDGYGAWALLTSMTDKNYGETLSAAIAKFHLARRAISAGVRENRYGAAAEYNFVINYGDSTVRYRTGVDEDTGEKYVAVPHGDGEVVFKRNSNGKIVSSVSGVEVDLAIAYFEFFTDAEKDEFKELCSLIDTYTNYVYSVYTRSSGSSVIKELSDRLFANATEKQIDGDGNVVDVPIDVSGAASHNEYVSSASFAAVKAKNFVCDGDVYLKRHKFVMSVIDYLCDGERFTYTLSPEAETNADLDGVENFLSVTHEGYFVQYASAVALILREAGIPARYVEGYVASDLRNIGSSGTAGKYAAVVLDSDEHAWVEVWFDGIGWVQYEVTPIYYSDAYPMLVSSQGGANASGNDGDKGNIPDKTPSGNGSSVDGGDEDLGDALTPPSVAQTSSPREEKIRAIASATAIVIAAAFAVCFVWWVRRRAKKAQDSRDTLVRKMKNASKSPPTRDEAREFFDLFAFMLQEAGFAPKKGELHAEYADRLVLQLYPAVCVPDASELRECGSGFDRRVSESAFRRMFAAIEAEEFGFGAPSGDLPTVALVFERFYARIYKRRVNALRRLYLRTVACRL